MNVCKKFRIEMAHRVTDAYTKDCRGLHGHSYVIEIVIGDKPVASFGGSGKDMVIDFTLIKDVVKPIINEMDHALMIYDQDKTLVDLAPILNKKYLIVPFNPTAENMAKWIYEQIAPLFEHFSLMNVTVHETESSYARYHNYDYNVDKQNGNLFTAAEIKKNIDVLKKAVGEYKNVVSKSAKENVISIIKNAVDRNLINLSNCGLIH